VERLAEIRSTFAEVAKPLALVLCILSLYAVFYAAFLNPSLDFEDRIFEALSLLALAATISVVSGMIFREAERNARGDAASLSATLPVQMFYWAAGVIFILFMVSWYLHDYVAFYRDVHF
jgi:hypothetical protein